MLVTLKLRESALDKVSASLTESQTLETDAIRDIFAAQYQQEAPVMTVKKLLNQDEHWICPKCDHRLASKNVICA